MVDPSLIEEIMNRKRWNYVKKEPLKSLNDENL